ncbi:Ubiquitin carboxyl-terminal hydrolase MINDY-1 [Taenia solium]|eukprot:TsM_000118000 transcript=TsM_000118000 gene=TsM_000118000
MFAANCIDWDEGMRLNYEENLSSALGIFPSLQTGLDINVRFTGVSDFEYTPALTIFDLFRIPLYHGWVVDPQDRDLVEALRNQTYNQVVEMIIDYKSSSDPACVEKGLLAEEFLETAASQLTMCGLCELSEHLQENQLAVLFRNNHFNTIYKKAVGLGLTNALQQRTMLLIDLGF